MVKLTRCYFCSRTVLSSLACSFLTFTLNLISSVQFSRSVMSGSLRPHEPQHARPPCSSPTPRIYLNPCPSSWWCQPTISPWVVPFSSCPQSFPASGSFQMSQLFTSGLLRCPFYKWERWGLKRLKTHGKWQGQNSNSLVWFQTWPKLLNKLSVQLTQR